MEKILTPLDNYIMSLAIKDLSSLVDEILKNNESDGLVALNDVLKNNDIKTEIMNKYLELMYDEFNQKSPNWAFYNILDRAIDDINKIISMNDIALYNLTKKYSEKKKNESNEFTNFLNNNSRFRGPPNKLHCSRKDRFGKRSN